MIRLPVRRRTPHGEPDDLAIYWLSREEEHRLSPDDRAAFEAWLAADPSHRAAFDNARAAICAPNRHSAHPEMMALRGEALASLKESRPSPWRYAAGAAVATALVAGGLGWFGLQPNTEPTVSRVEQLTRTVAPALNPNAALYETAVGERVSVTLPDGSVATLNTDSLIKVAYTGGERGVRLVRGQALFEVAQHKEVPFRVYAADRQITAVGTTFDVRVDRGKVQVALVEGVVSVARETPKAHEQTAPQPVQQVMLSAGEILQTAPAAPMAVRAGDAAEATAWKSGVVSFRATPLSEAVAEINRYTTNPLTIADPALAGYRITGVFRTGDPASFAQSVTEVLPVAVESSRDGSMTLVAGPKKVAPPG